VVAAVLHRENARLVHYLGEVQLVLRRERSAALRFAEEWNSLILWVLALQAHIQFRSGLFRISTFEYDCNHDDKYHEALGH
jgi:hypothetical protein